MNVVGWSQPPGFSVALPPGWGYFPHQGIDSFAGELSGDDVKLHFAISSSEWSLNPKDERQHEYTVHYENIDGVPAKLLIAVPGKSDPAASYDSATGVYFRDFGGGQLSVVGRGLTPEQQDLAIAIFRGIRQFR